MATQSKKDDVSKELAQCQKKEMQLSQKLALAHKDNEPEDEGDGPKSKTVLDPQREKLLTAATSIWSKVVEWDSTSKEYVRSGESTHPHRAHRTSRLLHDISHTMTRTSQRTL